MLRLLSPHSDRNTAETAEYYVLLWQNDKRLISQFLNHAYKYTKDTKL